MRVGTDPQPRGRGRDKRSCIYVVTWDEANLVKVGYSSDFRRRTGGYGTRGGALRAVHFFDDDIEAFDAERIAIRGLTGSAPYAFKSAEDARPYLGGKGSGYSECFSIDKVFHADVVEFINTAISEAYPL